ncbi:MAG: intradiol ring-cleavage dioxygenase [Rhizobiaceae bacterium]|nr:intradiol ring-cleavage dioxygenase [Rhizobiaceae bacterium]
MSKSRITRRRAMGLVAVTATGGAFVDWSSFSIARPAQAERLISGAGVCSIMPETTEGPYYFDPKLERREISEGKPGMVLNLRIQVTDSACVPIPGARVDIWHCDADGVYSGYPRQPGGLDTSGQAFLRGTQFADGEGVASFVTIFPGWYPGRTPHIHFKAFPNQQQVLTGQLFFDDDLTKLIYQTVAPYSTRGIEGATFNDRDGIAREAGPAALAQTVREGIALDAALVVSVAA